MILERGVFTQKITPIRVALMYVHGAEHGLRSRLPPPDKWRVECDNEKCPQQPCSWGFDTVQEAVNKWNYLIKSR